MSGTQQGCWSALPPALQPWVSVLEAYSLEDPSELKDIGAADIEKLVVLIQQAGGTQFQVKKARQALEGGDPQKLGTVLTRFQSEFDKHLIPACPSQLTAPVLHATLANASIAPHIWGCKGIGSQGDTYNAYT